MLDYHGLLNTEYTIGLYPYYSSQSTSVQPTAGYDPFHCCIHNPLSIQTHLWVFLSLLDSFINVDALQVVVRQLFFTRNTWFLNLDPNLRKSGVCFANVFTGGSLPPAIYQSHEKGVMMCLERSELNASADLISLLIRIKQKHLLTKPF